MEIEVNDWWLAYGLYEEGVLGFWANGMAYKFNGKWTFE